MDALSELERTIPVQEPSEAPDSCSKASLGERSFSFLAAPSGVPLDSANEIAAKADQFDEKNNRTVWEIIQAKSEHLRSK